MRYSSKDWWPVLIAFLQIALLVLPIVLPLSVLTTILLGLLSAFLIAVNYQCIAHNFIHLPFFKNQVLNTCFSVLNSLALGVPQSVYRLHHLNHHRYNNDPELDQSSTWRYGKGGKEEWIISYALLGLVRTDLVGLYRQAAERSRLVHAEVLALLLFVGLLAFIQPWAAVLTLLPTYALGQVFALWENYCEHHRAIPSDRWRDSVSCYNPVYNFCFFNNGYHQEHHLRPQVHWTQIAEVRGELPDDRVIVPYCHLTNSF